MSAERGVLWVLRAAATVKDDLKVIQRGRASPVEQLSKDQDELGVLLCCTLEQVREECRCRG